MKRLFSVFFVLAMTLHNVPAQNPVYDSSRVYDIVTDTDTFYLFSTPKPCFIEDSYTWTWAPYPVLLQTYYTSDTVTVYGVAITFENNNSTNHIVYDTISNYQALLMKPLGPSFSHFYGFSPVDSVTLNRSHPRFCWFLYEDDCDDKNDFLAQCYEFYFDTPEQINRMTDSFCVGRYLRYAMASTFSPKDYGGHCDNSYPSHVYSSGGGSPTAFDMYQYCDYSHHNRWGWAFPIIGFRCGPIQWDTLDSYTGDNAVVRWRSVEEGTIYNVRLVGDDGSDTTYITSDTTYTFTQLSDSVRYNVMLRKQCHYATSNYDTTVYGQWRSNIYFGTTILPDTTGGDTVGIVLPDGEPFSLAPNPAQGSVQVVLPKSATGGQLSLCDLTGRELMVRTMVRTEMELDISTLPTGTYLVKLTTPMGVSTKRLVVAR